jgi:pimeloyl-ACP methyl ester carboxylesterase
MDLAKDVWYHRWVAPDHWDNRPLLAAVPAPVLVVHGLADTALPPSMGAQVAAALGPRARLLQAPGLAHHEVLSDTSTLAEVRDFMRGASSR